MFYQDTLYYNFIYLTIDLIIGMKKTSVVFSTDRPFWQPPDWVFIVVWPILYTLEGFALWPVINDARWALASLFAAQALMAMMWTWTFSTFSRIKTAFWLLGNLFI
jgi:tryptophan-rich sensory protein